ncbi:MAG: porphobilinogen synthase, partial [Bacteroidota bacterium]
MHIRPRRNRKTAAIRALVEETKVSCDDFIFPLFLMEGANEKSEIESMPGIYRLGQELILNEIEECLNLGIKAFDIFPVVDEKHKDKIASKAYESNFFYLKALKKIKKTFPEA